MLAILLTFRVAFDKSAGRNRKGSRSKDLQVSFRTPLHSDDPPEEWRSKD
jgi:hypothetical protein